jgi:aldose 1-epimerase
MQTPQVKTAIAGYLSSGKCVRRYTLTNTQGMQAVVVDYGATLWQLLVPDAAGNSANVVLGYDDVGDYEKGSSYLGALVGRVANRIKAGEFSLDGKRYVLAKHANDVNQLHGGRVGFDKHLWQGEVLSDKDGAAVAFSLLSPDGDEGYPGQLSVRVVYRLTDANELIISYEATTTAPTVVNLTQHSYFNLTGNSAVPVYDHRLRIAAGHYTPTDATGIPSGDIAPVLHSALDFRTAKTIGEALHSGDPVLADTQGLDHNYCVSGNLGEVIAEVSEPLSGRTMQVKSTYPGMQLYSGNFLADDACNSRKPMDNHSGFCLECQYYPDAPNRPQFDSITLRPGEVYREVTSYQFSW